MTTEISFSDLLTSKTVDQLKDIVRAYKLETNLKMSGVKKNGLIEHIEKHMEMHIEDQKVKFRPRTFSITDKTNEPKKKEPKKKESKKKESKKKESKNTDKKENLNSNPQKAMKLVENELVKQIESYNERANKYNDLRRAYYSTWNKSFGGDSKEERIRLRQEAGLLLNHLIPFQKTSRLLEQKAEKVYELCKQTKLDNDTLMDFETIAQDCNGLREQYDDLIRFAKMIEDNTDDIHSLPPIRGHY